MAEPLVSINVLVVGDEGVGKTKFVTQQTEKQVSKCDIPTFGVSYHKTAVSIDGETTLIKISDSSGKECYRSLLPSFFNIADVVVLMFDVTNQRSFDNLQIWNDDLKSYCCKEVCSFVIGNKKDLSRQRKISEKIARQFSSTIEATYFECSSHTLSNVEDIFQSIILNVRLKWNSVSGIKMIPLYTPPNNSIVITKKSKMYSRMKYDETQTWGSYLLQIADNQLKSIANKFQSKFN